MTSFWYVQGRSEKFRSTETKLPSKGVHIRTIADRKRNLLAVSKQLSDIAFQSNSTTLMVENALADLLSQLKAERRTLPIANPLLKKGTSEEKDTPTEIQHQPQARELEYCMKRRRNKQI